VPVLVLLCVPRSEYSLNILSLWIYSLRTNVVANSDSLLSTTNNFTTYLSAYSVFLSSIAGVMISDYYLVRKGRSFIILSRPFLTTPGNLHIKELYSAKQTGPHFYTAGFNPRGYIAYLAGILINMVGFVGAIGKPVPIGATRIFDLNFFCGFIVAAGTYWILCKVWKPLATSDVWMEVGDMIVDQSMAYEVENEAGVKPEASQKIKEKEKETSEV
jgi:NCS1 family nucleobase:cation symporter-1